MMTRYSGSKEPSRNDRSRQRNTFPRPSWAIRALWTLLSVVVMSLLLLATVLLLRSGFLSTTGLSEEQTKSLWTFLGVALGAAVTLIGALLTEQNSRRTSALGQEAEERLAVDSVTKLLELTTIEGNYAPRARVAGAIATMIQLRGGAVAIRILGDLWRDDAVDSRTASWLIDRVMQEQQDSSGTDAADAAALLVENAHKLVPARGASFQGWYEWPSTVDSRWSADLPADAKNAIIVAAINVLLAREIAYWKEYGGPYPYVLMLTAALDDPEFSSSVAVVLCALMDSGALLELGIDITGRDRNRARELSTYFELHPWFEKLLERLVPWARGTTTAAPIGPASAGRMPLGTAFGDVAAGSTGAGASDE